MKLAVCAEKAFRQRQLRLRQPRAVGLEHLPVGNTNHMKNHIPVGRIPVMTVAVPVGSLHMYLNIAGPLLRTDPDLGIEEIRTGISVEHTRVDYPHLLAADRRKPASHQTVAPKILIQSLHTHRIFLQI